MSNFYDENDHALKPDLIVLRDSIGSLAVSILAAEPGFAKMSSEEKLVRLYDLIKDLQTTYEQANGKFD